MIGIGLMCGTSHDALDIALVEFKREGDQWAFNVLNTESIDIESNIKYKLGIATGLSALDLIKLDRDFSKFCANAVKAFSSRLSFLPEFIASHGVTIFHQPVEGITLQIGSGALISALTKLKVVCDFRTQDVSKGGQGAPLVPFADKHLFSDFDYTLNLGGFANISCNASTSPTGFDVSPCNLVLNQVANRMQLPYDKGGMLAMKGTINFDLLGQMNELKYYKIPPPKSLGFEWFQQKVQPLLGSEISPIDTLATAVEHIAMQIGHTLGDSGKCLVTGGGAFNGYLIERIRHHASLEIVLPTAEIIEFKEAICFAFLGMLRLIEAQNIDHKVTGSSSNSCAGAVYLP